MLTLFLLKRIVLNASKNIVQNIQYACYFFANITESSSCSFFFYMLDPRVSFLRFNLVNFEFSDIPL